jgi:heme A synthase
LGCLAHEITIWRKNKDTNKPFDIKAAHKLFMLYGWTILADLIVILAYYEYRKYTKIIHALIGTAILVTTLVTSLPSLLKNGFKTKHLTHYIIGVVIFGMMGLQLLLGVFKFMMVFFH